MTDLDPLAYWHGDEWTVEEYIDGANDRLDALRPLIAALRQRAETAEADADRLAATFEDLLGAEDWGDGMWGEGGRFISGEAALTAHDAVVAARDLTTSKGDTP